MSKKPRKVEKFDKFRNQVVVKAKTEGQKKYIQEIKNSDITFCRGPAGSGKTVIAVGLGLHYLLASNPAFEKIVVVRPVKEACGESLGYLPGQVQEKLAPWMAPIVDNMEVFVDKYQIKNLLTQQKVEVIPLAYMRGRSLNKSFIIVDEAQNCTPEQFLLILTRLGDGSKMVLNGDVSQSDVGKEGLSDAIGRLQGVPGVGFCELGASDIVRNPLISKVIERYSGG